MLLFNTSARLLESRSSKNNTDYVTLAFALPEHHRGAVLTPAQISEPNCRVTVRRASLSSVPVEPNRLYNLQVTVSVSEPNGKYPAALRFNLVNLSEPK